MIVRTMGVEIDIEQEKKLIRLVKQGNDLAFRSLYKQYAGDALLRIKKLVPIYAIAEELHQDTFLKIWERRASLDEQVPFRAVVMRTAKSLVIDFYRKAAREQALKEQLIQSATELYDHVAQYIDYTDTNQALQSAISKLPPQRLKVFTMCKIKGHTYEQAAEYFDISLSTVKDHMAKAIRFIKDEMKLNPSVLSLLLIIAYLD